MPALKLASPHPDIPLAPASLEIAYTKEDLLRVPEIVGGRFVRTVEPSITGTGTSDEDHAIELTELLTIADREFEALARMIGCRVIPHEWCLIDGEYPPDAFLEGVSLPSGYMLGAVVPKVIQKPGSDWYSYNQLPVSQRHYLADAINDYFSSLTKREHPKRPHLWDVDEYQALFGWLDGQPQTEAHYWYVDIEPRLRIDP